MHPFLARVHLDRYCVITVIHNFDVIFESLDLNRFSVVPINRYECVYFGQEQTSEKLSRLSDGAT